VYHLQLQRVPELVAEVDSIGEKPSISEASQDPGTLHQQPGTGVAGASPSCIGAEAGFAGV